MSKKPAKAAEMTDAELIKFAAGFRYGILGGRSSEWMCAMVCWPLSALLRLHGVENETIETDLGHCNHIWIKLADGRALDPTADQFNRMFPNMDLPKVYLGAPLQIHGITRV